MTKLTRLRRRLLLQYLLTVGVLLGASEVSFYCFSRWAGERELDMALRKDIETLASAIEVEEDGHVEFEGEFLKEFERDRNSGTAKHFGRMSDWQIVTEDGSTVGRSRNAFDQSRNLPPVGGREPALDQLLIADVEYGGSGVVRAARLRTVRQRPVRNRQQKGATQQIVFDIRTVVDRSALDQHLLSLAWRLTGGFPIVLALAAIGGYYLIQRAVRPVEEAFDRERRFTGTASHELRTPLTALRGEIDVALRHPRSTDDYVETLRRMEALVGRMTALIEGLLVLARADAGHLLSEASETSVAALEAGIREVIRQLPNRQRVLVTSTAPRAMRLPGDGFLLAIAVRNLVENSLLYAADGSVDLRITKPAAGGLELIVEDQGPGIPSEVLAAFDGKSPSGGALRERTGSGAGFGLSIARAVVESHGGKLTLKNRPESGCCATLHLPPAAEDGSGRTLKQGKAKSNRSLR